MKLLFLSYISCFCPIQNSYLFPLLFISYDRKGEEIKTVSIHVNKQGKVLQVTKNIKKGYESECRKTCIIRLQKYKLITSGKADFNEK